MNRDSFRRVFLIKKKNKFWGKCFNVKTKTSKNFVGKFVEKKAPHDLKKIKTERVLHF